MSNLGPASEHRVVRTMPLDAVLFDLDGLLVDTEPQWFQAETTVVAALGGTWGKRHQEALLGSNLEFAAEYMIRHTGSERTTAQVVEMLRVAMSSELAGGVTLRPGAADLVTSLVDHGVPLGIVTSSVREHLQVVLGFLPADAFRVTVTADDVANLKPHPEPYLLAMQLLQVSAARTVVLEDSPAGVVSGETAGCRVVAVPSVVDIEPRDGRHVVASLEDVDVATLSRLVTPS
jgi:HAD superfamily hydrolase (TIGR01509 family)